MEDLKWFFRKNGIWLILSAICIFTIFPFLPSGMPEEVWEPPVEIERTMESSEKNIKNTDEDIEESNIYEELSTYEENAKDDIKDDTSWLIPKARKELFSQQEKEQIEKDVMSIVKNIWALYENVTIDETLPLYSSGIENFTKEQRVSVVNALGENGVIAATEGVNMVNGEILKAFYDDYQKNIEGMVTIYNVNEDGLIGTITFLYRSNEIQTYFVGVKPGKNGDPQIIGQYVQEVESINYTDKGYFIYIDKYPMVHASTAGYWRVSPLSDECRELKNKFLAHLDFQKYNLMVSDWNQDTVSSVLMPGLFEDLYYMKYGEGYKGSNEKIPEDLFEEIMTTYLPVSVEQLKYAYEYDEIENTYCQETIYNSPYPPFLEVIDYTYNSDGTITLYADGVWPDYNSDYAFTNVVIVKPFEDGTFRFLSNEVEEKELKLPPIAYSERGKNN